MATIKIKKYAITPVLNPCLRGYPEKEKKRHDEDKKKYVEFAEKVNDLGIKVCEYQSCITFYIPMPKSWSYKKMGKMAGQPHRQEPRIEDLIKSLLDAIYPDGNIPVWDIRAGKYWAYEGSIKIFI